MSDIDNRQAYVFLDTSVSSEVIGEKGDQYLERNMEKWTAVPEGEFVNTYFCVRRPIQRTSQSDGKTIEPADKLTVWDEYAKSALEGILANSSEQSTFHSTVGLACEYADVMMKARDGK